MIKCKKCKEFYYKKESDLKKQLVKSNNLNHIENNLQLVLQKFWQPNKEIALGNEHIDLLCYKQRKLVIIELKRYRATYRAFAQILNYILQIQKKLPGLIKKCNEIHGLIVAHHITKNLADLVSKYQICLPEINLMEYHINSDSQFIINQYSYEN